jgi:hypothetical protein
LEWRRRRRAHRGWGGRSANFDHLIRRHSSTALFEFMPKNMFGIYPVKKDMDFF